MLAMNGIFSAAGEVAAEAVDAELELVGACPSAPEEADGSGIEIADKRGIESGKLGFEVAEVGSGGKESISGVRPGTRRATTFWIMFVF